MYKMSCVFLVIVLWLMAAIVTERLGSAIARPLCHSYGTIARNYPYP